MDGSPRAPSLPGASDAYAQWDAAYVLGALSEHDRREFESHMQGCPPCRQSVEELSGLPAILGQLSADDVADIDRRDLEMPPPRILTSLVAEVRRRRRRARWVTWTTTAAAAAAVVFAVTVGVHIRSAAPNSAAPRADASAVAMTRVASTELIATVAMTSHEWGTQIDMNCDYPAEPNSSDRDEPPDRLAMEVVGRDGSHDRLATWVAVKGIDATTAGSTSLPIDHIAAVQIVSADSGEVLLQRSV